MGPAAILIYSYPLLVYEMYPVDALCLNVDIVTLFVVKRMTFTAYIILGEAHFMTQTIPIMQALTIIQYLFCVLST